MPVKRKAKRKNDEQPRKYIAIESHRSSIVQHIYSDGEEDQLPEPTAEQKFAEFVQQIDFSQTGDVKKTLKNNVNPNEKNPLHLLRLAAGEIEQTATLLNIIHKGDDLIHFTQLTQTDEPNNKKIQQNYIDLKQRRETLLKSSERLKNYRSFAKKRQEKNISRINDALQLRNEWKLKNSTHEKKYGEIREWFEIDYSYHSCGSDYTAFVSVKQTPKSTSIYIPDNFINKSISLYIQTEDIDSNNKSKFKQIKYNPKLQNVILSPNADGINNINLLLENAQYSLQCNEIFSDLSTQARISLNSNLIPREQEIVFRSNFSQTLGIEINNNSNDTNEIIIEEYNNNDNDNSEWYFDMSYIHICLFKLLYVKYQIKYHNKYFKTPVHSNGLLSHSIGENQLQEISILNCIDKIISHMLFRKKVNNMLWKLHNAFSKSGGKLHLFGPHRLVKIHWIPTGLPFVSSVNVHMCEGCLVRLTIYENEVQFEDYNQKFTSINAIKEYMLLRFCKYILNQLQKEVQSQDYKVIKNGYSLVLPDSLRNTGFKLEVTIQPDKNEPSYLKEIITLIPKNELKPKQNIPLSDIPGCSYRSKICFILKQSSPNWFYLILQRTIQ